MTTKTERDEDASERLPEYLVERLAAGDLPAARADELRRRLALESEGARRLERLAASNASILDQHPPALVAAQIRRRTSASGKLPAVATREMYGLPRWGLVIGAPGALVAALALALWLRPAGNDTGENARADGETPAGDSDRSKGLRPTLRVYRKSAGKVERLHEGSPARAGDELQVAYVAAGHKYGVVLSVDGTGHVTYHLPATAGPAVRLRTDGEVALPQAYELDAAPGFEKFVLVVGDQPFDVAALTAAIQGQREWMGSAPAGTVAASFTVRKE
ncbi:MAG: ActD-like protein [Haliangium ochraceum]